DPPPPGGRELEAWISANCHLAPGGGKLLCSEEITLSAHGGGAAHLPALVSALQVPDVPAALVWIGARPSEAIREKRLLEGADRVVIDTGAIGGSAELVGVASLARFAGEIEVADLGWLRLGPFRLLLASLFDPPVGAEPLRRVS